MTFGFEIKNLSQVLRGIESYSKEIQQEIDDQLTKFAYDVVRDAQQLAPVDDGNLRAKIAVTRDEPFNKGIEAGAEYSAYKEFGTGTEVEINPNFEGLARYAMQFKGAGIRKVNLLPTPYFFPSIQKNSVELPKKLKDILEQK